MAELVTGPWLLQYSCSTNCTVLQQLSQNVIDGLSLFVVMIVIVMLMALRLHRCSTCS